MDTKSHLIFGEEICKYFDWSEDYAQWATAPDMDMGFLHRYYRHRFSMLEAIYREYPKISHGIPTKDKKIIGTLILSHFYLDIFNGPIFCWGIWLPASHIPPEMTDDLLNLIIKEQEKKFYEESCKSFKDILSHYSSQNEFCGSLLNTLRLATVWLPYFKFRDALNHFKKFTGWKDFPLCGDERYSSYYFLLKYHFKYL